MSSRPRHVNKELEQVIQDAEAKSWGVTHNPKTGYYRLTCPCGVHMKWLAKTPSGVRYEKNLRGWLARTGCW